MTTPTRLWLPLSAALAAGLWLVAAMQALPWAEWPGLPMRPEAMSLDQAATTPVGSGSEIGGIPPAWRNQRAPTGTDTPTFSAASAEVMPVAIRHQNCRCTAREGSGRPGERIGGRNARSARHCRRAPSGTSLVFAAQSLVATAEHLHGQGVATTS